MSNVLIYAIPADYHVHAVTWGLGHFGVACQVWVPGDLPDRATLSVEFGDAGRSIRLRQGEHIYALDDIQLIWNRRVAMPQAPSWAAETDGKFIEDECKELVNGLRHLLGRSVPTINPPLEQAAAARKLVQIEEARRAGFITVPTMVSNDYDEICRFRAEHGPIVAKPFRVAAWKQGDAIYTAHTVTLPEPREEWRRELELCPQIYQQRVAKQKEVRVIAFGRHRFAAEIVNVGPASDDLRYDMRKQSVEYRQVEVPRDVERGIAIYMGALGILYGAFDFIVDEAGRWIFLECNESGQFLFLEVAIPDLGLLDAFCRWMCELMAIPGIDSVEPIRLDDFSRSGVQERQAQRDWEVHKRGVVRTGLMLEDSPHSVDS
jgi:glutathione synthase/RimK-type ligase-like ATP-grasp enzyme